KIPLFKRPKSVAYAHPFRSRHKGAYRAIVTYVGPECDGRSHATRFLRGRRHGGVRRSRVVLAPRPWRLSMPACAGVATVTRNAAHRGEHEANRQTIARGKPV